MSRQRPIRDFALAVTLLTAVPLSVRWPEGDERPDIAGWFPAVGAGVGAVMFGVVRLLAVDGPSARLTVGFIAVISAALLTRGLHWDGLADVMDGWTAPDPQRRLEIMKDSRVGAFGALAIALLVGTQATAIAALAEGPVLALVVVAACFSRLAATFSAWIGRPARSDGLGAAICGRPGLFSALATIAAVVGVSWLAWEAASLSGGMVAFIGFLTALVVPDLVARRFGGVTGDTMGASVVITETLTLVAAVLLKGAMG